MLPAGEHYLANDRYPAGHWAKGRRRGQPAPLDEPVRSPAIAQGPVISPKPGSAKHRPNKETQPVGLIPTRKLLKAIIDAGGILAIDTKDDTPVTAAWSASSTVVERPPRIVTALGS